MAKLIVAKLCKYVSTEGGVSYKTLIPSNLYGYFDKCDVGVPHMLSAIIRKVREAPMHVPYG